jgi:hypothetical protein
VLCDGLDVVTIDSRGACLSAVGRDVVRSLGTGAMERRGLGAGLEGTEAEAEGGFAVAFAGGFPPFCL